MRLSVQQHLKFLSPIWLSEGVYPFLFFIYSTILVFIGSYDTYNTYNINTCQFLMHLKAKFWRMNTQRWYNVTNKLLNKSEWDAWIWDGLFVLTGWFAWPCYAAFTGCAVWGSVITLWQCLADCLFLWNNEWSNILQVSYMQILECECSDVNEALINKNKWVKLKLNTFTYMFWQI